MRVTMKTRREMLAALLLVGAVGLAGCGDTVINVPTAPTPAAPVTPPAPVPDKYEFRVIGQGHRNVTVRHTTGRDGTTQLTTDLPYLSSFTSLDSTMFLSLDASAFTTQVVGSNSPFLQAQILVNGTVVREASSNLFTPSLSISFTYRRP